MTGRRLCTQTACQGLERHIPNCGRRHPDDLNQALRRLNERRQRDHEQHLRSSRDSIWISRCLSPSIWSLVDSLGITRNHVVGGREAVRQYRRSRQVVLRRQRERESDFDFEAMIVQCEQTFQIKTHSGLVYNFYCVGSV